MKAGVLAASPSVLRLMLSAPALPTTTSTGPSAALTPLVASVTATFCGNETAAENFRQTWLDYPIEIVKFDISDYKETELFFQKFDREKKSLEVLVNNAGIRKDTVALAMGQVISSSGPLASSHALEP